MAAGGRIGPPHKSAKEILLEVLDADESGVDELVTQRHAELLADGLVDAMQKLGYEIRRKPDLLSALMLSLTPQPPQQVPVPIPHRCPNCGMVS